MNNNYKLAVLLTVLFSMLSVACSSIDDLNIFNERPPMLCPEVSILANSERLTIFKEGQGRDIIDIKTEALVDDFIAKCIYEVDDDTMTGQVLVELSFGFIASRGPANKDGNFTLPYFVTILDNNKQVLNKAIFAINSVFDGNRYRVSGYDNPIAMAIPVAPPVTGSDFHIYIGFQLTPDQMRYNQGGG